MDKVWDDYTPSILKCARYTTLSVSVQRLYEIIIQSLKQYAGVNCVECHGHIKYWWLVIVRKEEKPGICVYMVEGSTCLYDPLLPFITQKEMATPLFLLNTASDPSKWRLLQSQNGLILCIIFMYDSIQLTALSLIWDIQSLKEYVAVNYVECHRHIK